MSGKSNIEWTDMSWNPVTGCKKVSPGCDNCYAEAIAERYRGTPAFPQGFDVVLHPKRLNDPQKWKAPQLVFVNSMSDLFQPLVPDAFVRRVWDVMVENPQHTYQVLTKRPHKMEYLIKKEGLPLPAHIWLGTSTEDQKWADHRIPVLSRIEAPVRFISIEPMLGPVDLTAHLDGLEWVIVGGESGGTKKSPRRPFDQQWAKGVRDQCAANAVPFFYKQGSAFHSGKDRVLDGREHNDMPPARRAA